MDINYKFINAKTKEFFNEQKRHECICGGYGSGKTYVACFKLIFLATKFAGYRCLIARETFKDLKQTTLKTFLKICPRELIKKWDAQEGVMTFVNGSEFLWWHLDEVDESALRGLELNSCMIDQAEEVGESIHDLIAARCGRWEKAVPIEDIRHRYPQDEFGNYQDIPSYLLLTCNPEDETHWIYRRYHPDSDDHERWADSHAYYEVASDENPYLNPETLKTMLSRDPAWVKRFVKGQWGISESSIHIVYPDSILECSDEWIRNFIKKANLYRSMDHGDSSPTCCLWWASLDKIHVCYREYYQPNASISTHRRNITDLSIGEDYGGNWADPSIFKQAPRAQQTGGLRWNVADEYRDAAIDAPKLSWIAADNNELATRNRINEYLALSPLHVHPVNHVKPAPRLYFIKKQLNSPFGCHHAIIQTRSQRKVKLGEINGKPFFSDERDEGVTDHAYDCVRYYIAMHARAPIEQRKKPSENSFLGARRRFKMLKQAGSGELRPKA